MLQHDDRVVYGLKASKTWLGELVGSPMTNVVGLQARYDDIRDVGLFPTFQRQIIGSAQNAAVEESNAAVYVEDSVQWLPSLRTVVGLREDQFDFNVTDKLLNADGTCDIGSDPLGCNTGAKRASIFSPKLGIVVGPFSRTTFFFNIADGYHSNDARGITRSGENPDATAVSPLTRATSAEIGLTSSAIADLQTSLDVFELKLQSELTFDGDAGVTSPSGASTRQGIEWGNTYRLNSWLTADLNAAFSKARFDRQADPDDLGCGAAAASHPCTADVGIVGRYIPNSPTNVIGAGLTIQRESGWFGALKARHFGQSPLVEDNSVRSPAYTTVDGQIGYRVSGKWLLALDGFNLFDVKWNDIEYYYVSRLKNAASPSADYVVHPGVPVTFRLHFQYFL
jgi:outer membrane receptor protein involved in Fe transport